MSQITQVYGGDEVNAVVLDPGSEWTRVGWSAEDGPSITMSSWYGVKDGEARFGDHQTYLVRRGTEIKNPMVDSVVNDWEAATGLWKTALSQASPSRDTEYLTESPLLMMEPIWNTKEAQKRMMKFAIEDLNVPAMYIGKIPVLNLFSAGRGTGIVIDIGAQTASAVAILDGFVLFRSAQRSRKAGNYLIDVCQEVLGPEVYAPFEIKNKTTVKLGESAVFTRRLLPADITESFRDFQRRHVINEFKESMVQVPDMANFGSAAKLRTFEFPDGHSVLYGDERYKIGERIFTDGTEAPEDRIAAEPRRDLDKATATTKEGETKSDKAETKDEDERPDPAPWSTKGISDVVSDCLNACDVDARANLANNIVVTGGTTLTQGFTERLNQDLQRLFPMLKIRIFASGNMVERRNGAWIGGSILSSLGTFHQLWVTRQEFEEIGEDQLAFKRFK